MISFTLIENSDGLLTKSFKQGDDGQLVKKTAGKLFKGTAKRVSVNSPREFVDFIGQLEPTQALAFGVTDRAEAPIVTQDELAKTPGAIARDRAHFRRSQQPAIMLCDYDYDPAVASGPPLTPEQVRAKLIEACPALAEAPMIAVASASSFIYEGPKQLKGASGVHLYIFGQNGADIDRAGAALCQHLWRIGTGHYIVSKSGALLSRCLLDSSVFQPERLDFVAGAHCFPPLDQRRPTPTIWNEAAPLFDTRRIADPTAEELEVIKQAQIAAKELAEPQRKAARDAYVTQRVADLIDCGVSKEDAQLTAEHAADQGVLLADFRLTKPDGKEVTVGDLLKDPTKWHGQRFRDPMEPDYRGDHRIAQVNLFSGGRPYIYSHAHGGRRFELVAQTRVLKLQRGSRVQLQDQIIELLRLQGDVFDQPIGGGQNRMVLASNGHLVPFTEVSLATYIGRFIRLERYDKRTKITEPVDVPMEVVRGIMGESTSRKLKVIEGVVSDPVMRADGSILKTAGYSERDRLLSLYDSLLMPIIPDAPTREQLQEAFRTLWRPFDLFPFVDGNSRAAMLAALLTSVVRPMIGTRPAFMFEAPSAGTGKSLLAKCVAALVTGRRASASTPPPNDDEMKKTLFAALRDGERVIFFDNFTQPVHGSPALCAFLTSPEYGDRVLRESRGEKYTNRALMLMTGNNPRIEGDACRRVIRVRIDAQEEFPAMRSFDLEPESFALDHRDELWAAALTLLRGYQTAGAPRMTKDRFGSFEQWDALVRQAVLWIQSQQVANVELGDPCASAIENVANDPVKDVVGNVLVAMRQTFRDEWKTPSAVCFDLPSEVLEAIDPKGISTTRLGLWLQKHVNEVIGGLQLVSRKNSVTKNWEYRVFERRPTPPALNIRDFV